MRAKTFNHSLLAIGVAAVLGLSTTANAASGNPASTNGITDNIDIINQASAVYNVSGQQQPKVVSNTVRITISEQVAFSLSSDNDDGTIGDDKNVDVEVVPKGFATFTHTLTNKGNSQDTYTISLNTNDAQYDTDKSTVSYIVYYPDGNIRRRSEPGEDLTYAEANGIESILEKDEYVKFTINAKTINNKGGDSQSLTISARSKALTDKSASVTELINTNTSFTRLPTFSIVKTITNGLDLNNLNDTAIYKVVVTNETTGFSAAATNVAIADILPNGLVLAEAITSTNLSGSSVATSSATIATGSESGDGFNVTGINIPVGQNIIFTFEVKQGTNKGLLIPDEAINHVTVTDDLDDNDDTDNTLVDSTDVDEERNIADFYPTTNLETNYTDGVERTLKKGDDSTGPLSSGGTILRGLTLTGPTFREIAPTSGIAGQVNHSATIENTGKDAEGSKAGELTFTITYDDSATPPVDAINIVSDSVTITYNGVTSDPITPNAENVYDIFDALGADGIAAGATATINYKVSSAQASLFTPDNSTNPTFKDTIVTLIPKLEGAPTAVSVTDRTTVRGLVLLKTQAIDKTCSGSATTFVSTPLKDALPGECIIYRVEAKNTSSSDPSSPTGVGFTIKDIVILDDLDNFDKQATYVPSSATTTASAGGTYTATNNGAAITTTIGELAPQATATMQFSVKIKTDGITPNP